MTTVYVTEITSDDDEPETEHEGEPVEQLQPVELPVHTLTAEKVAAAAAEGGGQEEAMRTTSSAHCLAWCRRVSHSRRTDSISCSCLRV